MVAALDWLALEVTALERAVDFYAEHLDLPVAGRRDGEAALSVGGSELRLRTPGPIPGGGVHTHFALTIPADAYDVWWDRLDASPGLDLAEHDFGGLVSLYFDDPDGHCVELAAAGDGSTGTGIGGVFEVVLEVKDLDRAEAFYRDLGGEVTGCAETDDRLRLDMGAFDIELWTPRLGIAEGRGGLHVDVGLRVADPETLADRVRDRARVVERLPADAIDAPGIRLRDADGHSVTLRPERAEAR